MCRSIKVLRQQGRPAAPEELNAAALQFVRKISGYHHPSQANQEAFNLAIAEIAASSKRLLDSLTAPRRAADRERSQIGLGPTGALHGRSAEGRACGHDVGVSGQQGVLCSIAESKASARAPTQEENS